MKKSVQVYNSFLYELKAATGLLYLSLDLMPRQLGNNIYMLHGDIK